MPRKKFNHQSEDLAGAIGLDKKTLDDKVVKVFDDFNKKGQRSPSLLIEHLESSFNKRELSFVAAQALDNAQGLLNQLEDLKGVLSGTVDYDETQG